jgi:hypothetical protein
MISGRRDITWKEDTWYDVASRAARKDVMPAWVELPDKPFTLISSTLTLGRRKQ